MDYNRNPERTQLESAFRAGECGYMPNDKLILLIYAKVLPEHRAELLQALRETLLQQEYTKKFFATFEGGLAGEPVITNLSELS
jgi:quinol monooxygenase YgiN